MPESSRPTDEQFVSNVQPASETTAAHTVSYTREPLWHTPWSCSRGRAHDSLPPGASRRHRSAAGQPSPRHRPRSQDFAARQHADHCDARLTMLDTLTQDVKYATRSLRRTPGFLAAAIATL